MIGFCASFLDLRPTIRRHARAAAAGERWRPGHAAAAFQLTAAAASDGACHEHELRRRFFQRAALL